MILYSSVKRHGHLAQLVESLLDVQVVSGSIPLVSTIAAGNFGFRRVFLSLNNTPAENKVEYRKNTQIPLNCVFIFGIM